MSKKTPPKKVAPKKKKIGAKKPPISLRGKKYSIQDAIPSFEPPKFGDPLVIEFRNLTGDIKHCELLGFGKNYRSENFGSDEGVRVENLQGHKYEEILCYSAFKPFILGKIRIQFTYCSGVEFKSFPSKKAIGKFKEMVQKCGFTFINRSGDGKRYESPLLSNFMSSSQNNILHKIIDIDVHRKINFQSLISFSLQPRDRVIISLFPLHKAVSILGRDEYYS